ncbi:MAG: precorrin-3B C(17)-methyltransferase [Candidatus Omnitrophota bacterium]
MSKTSHQRRYRGSCQGKLSIVGIGPGDLSCLTQKARQTIKCSQVIVGYKTYIALLGNLTKGKEVISSGMTEEIKRAQEAIQKGKEGKNVSVISSGDPGIYGMAGLVLELLNKKDIDTLRIEVIPGVPSATACASLLGAPLANDFAVISLSDLLTDKNDIIKRLKAASQSDFVIVLYNPKSKKRIEPLKMAWRIIAKRLPLNTPVGIVKNAFRSGQEIIITTLKKAMALDNIDMTTTVIVGNSKTYLKNGYMITPRGYFKIT